MFPAIVSYSCCLKTLISRSLQIIPLCSHLEHRGLVLITSVLIIPHYSAGMAVEVQPSGRLRGQVLLLPHVPRGGLHGVEAVLRPGSSEQVRLSAADQRRSWLVLTYFGLFYAAATLLVSAVCCL